jgi:hypothetical protein
MAGAVCEEEQTNRKWEVPFPSSSFPISFYVLDAGWGNKIEFPVGDPNDDIETPLEHLKTNL